MRKSLILIFASLVIAACTSESAEDIADLNPNNCDIRDVGYRDDIQALLSNACGTVGCHGGPNDVGGLNLNNYADAKRIADNDQLLRRVNGMGVNIMPPGAKLPKCEIDKLTIWVQGGAPNN